MEVVESKGDTMTKLGVILAAGIIDAGMWMGWWVDMLVGIRRDQ